ncbi:hypothetical protein COL154_014308 [Colletotrichum chrysophilum]|nr:hypothetical protein COL154_014308 [Colletotrichum chrysophilum]
MPQGTPDTVCVVIAAYNAHSTVERAVRSALQADHVAEVIVVDDCSDDNTRALALACDDSTGRLSVLASERNGGPAVARNRAIMASTAPLIAVLDADDFYLPGRFSMLLGDDDWDLVADNIAFVHPDHAAAFTSPEPFQPRPRFLDLATFIEGNISKRGHRRAEIGFLKPVMRRSFLTAYDLHYRETLRLGEDYELYTRALARGARYKVVDSCGYVAVERPDSLSGSHSTSDLLHLYEADESLFHHVQLNDTARTALVHHAQQIRAKYEHRNFLDIKREAGLTAAALHAMRNPRICPGIAKAILTDKMEAAARRRLSPASTHDAEPRYLFNHDASAA